MKVVPFEFISRDQTLVNFKDTPREKKSKYLTPTNVFTCPSNLPTNNKKSIKDGRLWLLTAIFNNISTIVVSL